MSQVALSLVRGNDATFAVVVLDHAGVTVNLTGGALTFAARYQATDTTPVLTATLAINADQTGHKGEATLTLVATQTALLSAPLVLVYAISLYDASHLTSTPIEGTLLLTPDSAAADGTYCTLLDVKQRMSGDQPVVSDAFDGAISAAIVQVTDMFNEEVRNLRGQGEGWSFLPGTPTTSRYTGKDGGARLLLIDDSVAVSSVAILDAVGNVSRTLVAGTDYLPYPLNSLPIVGLTLTNGRWPSDTGAVRVGRTPGYAASTPANVQGAAIAEVIRSVRAGQAGEDDRLGMSPFGSVMVSKALLQSTVRMLNRYRFGAGMLRS